MGTPPRAGWTGEWWARARPRRRWAGNGLTRGGAVGLVVLVLASSLAVAAPSVPHPTASPSASRVDYVNVSTTSKFRFVPNQVYVYPGALVRLVVTQLADFAHSFVLSPVVNYTIPTSDTPIELYAFFNAHPPLVNLSLPGTPGYRAYANFTAPPVGAYEFVCEVPSHFQAGMYGTLVSTTHPPSGGSPSPFTPAVVAAIAVAVIVVAVLAGVLVVRRRARRGGGGAP